MCFAHPFCLGFGFWHQLSFFLSFWLSVLIMSCCSLLRIPAAQLGNSWDDDEEIQDLSLQQLLMTIDLQIIWQAGN
jgi:hypothetical protein